MFLDPCVYPYVNGIAVKPCYKAMVRFHYLTRDRVYPIDYLHSSCHYDYIPYGVRWVDPSSFFFFSLLCFLYSPLIQFNLLHSKFHLCSVPTRALLLSAYIKFINLFPEIKPTIQDVLRSDSQLRNADVELQQRAVEYLRLSSIASNDILVCPWGEFLRNKD